jgi:hypothetical protein
MAQAKSRSVGKKRNALQSVIKRLRARLKKQSKPQNKTRMAFGRSRSRFRNPFRSRSRGTFRQRGRRNYSSGGFSRRAPLLGFKVPNILIWLAIIGGGIFFGRDYIKPLIEKLKNS